MNDQRDGWEPADDEDEDLGVPVIELNTLTEELPPRGFFDRVRRTIERRRLSSDVAELSLGGVVMVFLELMRAVFGIVGESGRDGQGEKR